MKIKFSHLFLVLPWMCILSCNKQDDTFENTKWITQNIWKITAVRSKINTYPWIDKLSAIPSCEKDDLLIFLPSGVILYNTGLTICSGTENETRQGTWEFTNHGSNIIISSQIPVTRQIYEVTQLDENILKLTSLKTTGTGAIETTEQTYRH